MTTPSQLESILKHEAKVLLERLDRIGRDHGAQAADFAEQAVQRQNDDVLDELERSISEELRQIEAALARFELGVADCCEVCNEPIDVRRLVVLPYATQCAACVSAREGATT